MLWEVDIFAAPGFPDVVAQQLAGDAHDLGIADHLELTAGRGYLLQGDLSADDVDRLTRELLADLVVERTITAPVGDESLRRPPQPEMRAVHVLPKPGVMDPVAESAKKAIADFGLRVEAVRTFKKYWVAGLDDERLAILSAKLLANDAIEQTVVGPLELDHLEIGRPYRFALQTVPIRELDDEALKKLSIEGQLYLSLTEMQTIRNYYRELGRDPTDVELETIAQTWSEHCSHKTLAGRIEYHGPEGVIRFENMLKETIFAATRTIRERLGADDWCVSVFRDNAGIVRFDDEYNVVFKVETHNHPSALEPYGGANTGIGGVIRDPMGTGLGAKPICNTDVFCFAPPDVPGDSLPPGVLHPRRVIKGVVAGVRDYGNRMGIPTINGAVFFDERYLGNPLVYCGNVGIIPRDKSEKNPQPGDLIVALGGRTGRDGIHGATFSSAELTSESETVSGGAVQIGNAIVEKMLLDVLMVARDRGLYHAVTDCGAGGFSSAVGEMGEKIGAEVQLENVPLKYEGLSYTEIWISEAQERMVLAVPEDKWPELKALCDSEDVEATVIGRFVPTGRLVLKYGEHQVADLDMRFLHDGRPPVVRRAEYAPPQPVSLTLPADEDFTADLKGVLGSLNVCSKHWIIRQYDHEVQGGSVVKPLVGVACDGPSDAAVVRPRIDSNRGLAIACGMNPCYGDFDTYRMAASAIDEAIRNCVAVGADPRRIAILDNFCWGNTDRPETLGSLVRAALACRDLAVAYETPFISGKDSLNNEFRPESGEPIAIPPSLLISAMGQLEDVEKAVTMDFKSPGNPVYIVGLTRNEMGGSHFAKVRKLTGGDAPTVDPELAKPLFAALHRAIESGYVRACHDLSEGGLAVSLAEMAFSGGCGAEIDIEPVPRDDETEASAAILFSESNSRFLVEVDASRTDAFEQALAGIPFARIGVVSDGTSLVVRRGDAALIRAEIDDLKAAWQGPLDW
ncbi:phosphoribosylformylglycinamidine synthase subunit PurL [Thermostilla marina]